MTKTLLGIDVSTTGVKALLIDSDGAIVDSFTSPLQLSNPRPLWSEQHPHDWWQAAINSIQQVLRKTSASEIAAIGLTGQMHGLVLLDERGEVLRPAILWNDQRCAAECDEIRACVGKERLVQASVTMHSPVSLRRRLSGFAITNPMSTVARVTSSCCQKIIFATN